MSATDLLDRHAKDLHFATLTDSRDPIGCGPVVRVARPDDLPGLLRLEEACWAPDIRAPRARIETRLRRAASHPWVIEFQGRLVAVLYAQRIATVDDLATACDADVESLHRADGSTVQFLALNVDPEGQDQGLGDRLLELALRCHASHAGTDSAVAVTRCRDYRAQTHGDHWAYVQARDEHGLPVDPIVRFHVAHGAEVLRLVPGYRPGDHGNQGHGVLVHYPLATRQGVTLADTAGSSLSGPSLSGPEAEARIATAIKDTLGARRDAFAPERSLRDMGLDSLDLHGLALGLRESLGREVSVDQFFRAGSANALARELGYRSPAASKPLRNPTRAPDRPPPSSETPREHVAEPVAIVGVACRFPGAPDLDSYWNNLLAGHDSISVIPDDRGPGASPSSGGTPGGTLGDVTGFDAEFFGLSSDEAQATDPQQRLALELAWEALEDAAISPDEFPERACSIHVGCFPADYAELGAGHAPGPHVGTGNSPAMLAGRLAYVLGTQGRAITVETACSSSLVAVDMACEGLSRGEVEVAIAGGVNLVLSPTLTRGFERAGMLAPDGRCKTFDRDANGYVRSEGGAFVVLQRLDDALAQGRSIVAVIRGSAVNNDGASNGLTAPNGDAQEAVMRSALARAGVDADSIDLVETHGTGTVLGDRVEVRALASVYGERTRSRPLYLGAAKTSIGHTEAAAGIAGLLQAALALREGQVPPNGRLRHLHLELEPLLQRMPAVVPTQITSLRSATEAPRRAAVSSFGFSGTNCHMVIEQAPAPAERTIADDRPGCFPLCATTPAAFEALRTATLESLASSGDGVGLDGLIRTAAVGRTHKAYRRAVVVGDSGELARALARMTPPTTPSHEVPRVAFVFTGQGALVPGVAREIYERHPVFRDRLERAAQLLDGRIEADVRDVLFTGEGRFEFAQPVTFALQVALVELWRSWGIEPAAVTGHSVGALAAAWTAGVFGFEDGLHIAATRGRLMSSLPATGRMLALRAAAETLDDLARARGLSIAAINGDQQTVLSGPADDIEAAARESKARGIVAIPLANRHAFHSPAMAGAVDGFEIALSGLKLHRPQLPFISDRWGRRVDEELVDPRYWGGHIVECVQFRDATRALPESITATLEIGPGRVLADLARVNLQTRPSIADHLASLDSGREDDRQLLGALARLYERGAEVNWAKVRDPSATVPARLPTYPFQRKPHWLARAPRSIVAPATHAQGPRRMPLRLPKGTAVHGCVLDLATMPWIAEHRVQDTPVVPAAAHLLWMERAAREQAGGPVEVVDVVFLEPLRVEEACPRDGRILLERRADEGSVEIWDLVVSSRPAGDEGTWTDHALGQARAASELERVREPSSHEASVDERAIYDALSRLGLHYGPRFRTITRRNTTELEARGQLEIPPAPPEVAAIAALDAVLQMHVSMAAPDGGPWLPARVASFRRRDGLATARECRVRTRSGADTSEHHGDGSLVGEDGQHVATLDGLVLRRPAPAWHGWPLRERWCERDAPRGPAQALSADRANELATALDELALSHAARALNACGGWEGSSEHVVAERAPLSSHLKRALRSSGTIEVADDGSVTRRSESGDPSQSYAALRERFPEASIELELVQRFGDALAGVLRGRENPLELLFPGGKLDALRALYEDSLSFGPANAQLRARVVAALASRARTEAPIRILEIGGGTASTTAQLLSILPAHRFTYTFTDIGPMFVQRARERFADRPNLRGATLDIERDPAEQGFELGTQDIVIAANVLHATRDLDRSLAHARSLLAPGGELLILEGVEPRLWVDLIFGTTSGWWRFADSRRETQHPLISSAQWRAAFRRAELEDGDAIRPSRGDRVLFPQAVLTARAPGRREADRGGAMVLFMDRGDLGRRLDATYRARGIRTLRIWREPIVDATADDFVVSAPAPEGVEAVLSKIVAALKGTAIDQIVHLWALDAADANTQLEASDLAGFLRETCASVLALLRAGLDRSRLWLATSRAVRATADDRVEGVAASPLSGLTKVIALEFPNARCTHLDITPELDPQALILEIDRDADEGQIALRPETRTVARVEAVKVSPAPGIRFSGDGAHLIVGGRGGLGAELAAWMIERGARTLVLAGRSDPARSAELRQSLAARGARVEIAALDVVDEGACAAVLDEMRRSMGGVRSVIHAAGVLADGVLVQQAWPEFESVLQVKTVGAWNLHRLTAGDELEHFVLFSSTASLLGSAGQGNHAAANAFLDALADMRHAQGLPALSLNWGGWSRIGAWARRDIEAHWRAKGIEAIDPAQGFAALDWAMSARDLGPRVGLVPVHWPTFLARRPPSSTFEAFAATTASPEPVVRPRPSEAARPSSRAHDPSSIEDEVVAQLAALLGRDAGDVPRARGFFQIGLDSLSAVELRARLQATYGVNLSATVTFDHPSARTLARELSRRLNPRPEAPTDEIALEPSARERDRDTPRDTPDTELMAKLRAAIGQSEAPT